MHVISLTSIPPRFAKLPLVLDSLVAQDAAEVWLCLPHRYERFPGTVVPPTLPEGVRLIRCAVDYGPATKLLGAIEAGHLGPITYCDDDVIYEPGWLEALRPKVGVASAGSGWSVSRLKRIGVTAPGLDIAQGFSGVTVTADMFDPSVFDVPSVAWPVDDIWLSGHLARSNVAIVEAPSARRLCKPFSAPSSLQDSMVNGVSRAEANAKCAAWLNKMYGVWPSRS